MFETSTSVMNVNRGGHLREVKILSASLRTVVPVVRNSTGPRMFAYIVHTCTLVNSMRRDGDGERQSLELQFSSI